MEDGREGVGNASPPPIEDEVLGLLVVDGRRPVRARPPGPGWSFRRSTLWAFSTALALLWGMVLILPALLLTIVFFPLGFLLLAVAVTPLYRCALWRIEVAPRARGDGDATGAPARDPRRRRAPRTSAASREPEADGGSARPSEEDGMTARQEILEVARDLTARGLVPFSPHQILAEMRARGSAYKSSTIMTYVTSVMCANASDHLVTSYADLRRVGRGAYVLNDDASASLGHDDHQPEGSAEPRPTPDGRPWSWEGHVQAAFVDHLAAEGWTIVSTADTASRAQGPDVVAERDGQRLIAEVKGYPHTTKASVHTQARHYVGGALLTTMLTVAEQPNARVGLVFPDAPTYRRLVVRMREPLTTLGLSVWFVHEGGRVEPWLDA